MKSLFNSQALQRSSIEELGSSSSVAKAIHLSKPTTTVQFGTSLQHLKQVIGQLAQNEVIPFATHGKWSSHELLRYLLQFTGPASVSLTTWAITEEPLRMIHKLIEEGQITEFNCVFDYRTEKRKPEALQFAQCIVSRVKLTHCHAKILVVQNDHWQVTVVSSANFTNNPRLEAGTIFTLPAVADFYKNVIDNEINK
ncbi:hypothetical protein SAMN05421780_1146 [Flexibacter flexilis DSM 6793]|uniref:PLD phosphodiesterase domain-containing protein n=1 Tax=Flexibacter flexilis DSM 6793 TaxID=927664 RepID=A0A1I1NCE7_9BACT|nr:hypothetical protein [Flexibacter flexilis]SFC95145.1 hypothetical protein SAMN05421780_1146 [Flexibacter flexilis DSM 6793]